jgi:hypothetical protein
LNYNKIRINGWKKIIIFLLKIIYSII